MYVVFLASSYIKNIAFLFYFSALSLSLHVISRKKKSINEYLLEIKLKIDISIFSRLDPYSVDEIGVLL